MKIRNGFVSNSSSSSFILHFSKLIETPEEIATDLGLDCFNEHHELFENIFNDMYLFSKSLDIEEFYFNIDDYCDILGVDPEYPFMKKSCEELYKELSEKCTTSYEVTYCDEGSSYGSKMENVMWNIVDLINDETKVKGINEH